MYEPALLTLFKIVGTLVVSMSIIPLLFLFGSKGGESGEPKDVFDTD